MRMKTKGDFHQNLFFSLQSLHDSDVDISKQHALQARLQIIRDLKKVNYFLLS